MRYETKVVDCWADEYYIKIPGWTNWRLIGYQEYYYEMPTDEQHEKHEEAGGHYAGRMAGQRIRAVYQREIGGMNWAVWLTGAAIIGSIWATALFIL